MNQLYRLFDLMQALFQGKARTNESIVRAFVLTRYLGQEGVPGKPQQTKPGQQHSNRTWLRHRNHNYIREHSHVVVKVHVPTAHQILKTHEDYRCECG